MEFYIRCILCIAIFVCRDHIGTWSLTIDSRWQLRFDRWMKVTRIIASATILPQFYHLEQCRESFEAVAHSVSFKTIYQLVLLVVLRATFTHTCYFAVTPSQWIRCVDMFLFTLKLIYCGFLFCFQVLISCVITCGVLNASAAFSHFHYLSL